MSGNPLSTGTAAATVPDSPAAAVAHDAAEGFHDLKPLPEFSPLPETALWTLLLLAAAAALGYLLYKKIKRGPKPPPAPPPIPPDEAALAEIDALEGLRRKNALDVRELCARLSALARRYLEQMLEIPAAEQTTAEVLKALPPALKATFSAVSQERLVECFQNIRSLLRFCERATFEPATDRAHTLESSTITAQFECTKRVVTEIKGFAVEEKLRREREEAAKRKRSEAEQSGSSVTPTAAKVKGSASSSRGEVRR